MHDFNLILQTDKLLLRPIKSDDYNLFKPLCQDTSMWTYFTSDLSVDADLKNWIDQAVYEIENKIRLAFTIIYKSNNQVIGSSSFGNISFRDKRLEIGWTWLAKSFQGKGINREVKLLMLQYCFETLNFERVEFKTDVLNIPARKALLNLGAKEEGILRSHTLMTHGRRRDTIYYSILKHEWEEIKNQTHNF